MSYGPYGSPAPYSTGPAAYSGDPTAVLGRRYLAFIIDTIIAIVIVVVVMFSALHRVDTGGDPNFCANYKLEHSQSMCLESGSDGTARVSDSVAALYGVYGLIWLLNNVLLEGLIGGTVGKLTCGLRVIKHDGEICGLGRALVRNLLLSIPDGVCCGVVGIATSASTKGHKRVGDMVAGTLVVSKSQVGKPPNVPGVTTPQFAAPTYGSMGYGGAPYGGAPGYGGAPTDTPGYGGPGYGGTTPYGTAPTYGSPPAGPTSQPDYQADAPTWDPKRNTYIQYDTARAAWLEYDQAARQWKPISQ